MSSESAISTCSPSPSLVAASASIAINISLHRPSLPTHRPSSYPKGPEVIRGLRDQNGDPILQRCGRLVASYTYRSLLIHHRPLPSRHFVCDHQIVVDANRRMGATEHIPHRFYAMFRQFDHRFCQSGPASARIRADIRVAPGETLPCAQELALLAEIGTLMCAQRASTTDTVQ